MVAARVAAVLVVLFFVGVEVAVSVSDYDVALLQQRPEPSLRLEDRHGQLLAERVNARGQRHRWVPLAEISPTVIAATIAVEDSRFYDHVGVDWRGVGRAAVDAVRAGAIVSGASTITMQLVRSVQPHPYRGLAPKMVELVRALRMERAVDKRVILEQYLNRVPYGAGTIGIEAASWRYFGKPNKALTQSEATLLAGLPQAPSLYNPLRHYERALGRRFQVLRRMLEEGVIDGATFTALWRDRPELTPTGNPGQAPHATDTLVGRGVGGAVATTLDGPLQRSLEAIVADRSRDLATLGAPHAAVVVLDNRQCDVVAMVGSPDYRSAQAGAVNGALAKRQPGSTLKPFVFALAFQDGAHEGTVVADVPTRYVAPGGVLFSPRNFDRTYSGPVPMGEALARSLNVPAIVTAQDVGLKRFYRLLKRLGFESLTKPADHYGLGLSLGNGEVRLLELAQGYAALARYGRGCRARLTSEDPVVTSLDIAPTAAARITQVLADDGLRAQAFGAGSALMLDVPVAMKTGTSANWRDSWAVGYTRDHTVAVWVGDFASDPTQQLTGATGAGPLFRQAMELVLGQFGTPRPLVEPAVEAQLGQHEVCALSGAPASHHCPHRRWVRTGAAHEHRQGGAETCDWHRPIRVERTSGLLAGPACNDADAVTTVATYLPSEYAEWQALDGRPGPPTQYSARCPGDGSVADAVRVTWPQASDVFVLDPTSSSHRQSLLLRAAVEPRVAAATWMVDGRAVGTVAWPYEMVWQLRPGRHQVQLVAGQRRSPAVTFEVR